jgi:hypothetical protein
MINIDFEEDPEETYHLESCSDGDVTSALSNQEHYGIYSADIVLTVIEFKKSALL